MFHAGAEPFWSTDTKLSSGCLSSYKHPALGIILAVFIPYYGLTLLLEAEDREKYGRSYSIRQLSVVFNDLSVTG
jgi:hypothetical protein